MGTWFHLILFCPSRRLTLSAPCGAQYLCYIVATASGVGGNSQFLHSSPRPMGICQSPLGTLWYFTAGIHPCCIFVTFIVTMEVIITFMATLIVVTIPYRFSASGTANHVSTPECNQCWCYGSFLHPSPFLLPRYTPPVNDLLSTPNTQPTFHRPRTPPDTSNHTPHYTNFIIAFLIHQLRHMLWAANSHVLRPGVSPHSLPLEAVHCYSLEFSITLE